MREDSANDPFLASAESCWGPKQVAVCVNVTMRPSLVSGSRNGDPEILIDVSRFYCGEMRFAD